MNSVAEAATRYSTEVEPIFVCLQEYVEDGHYLRCIAEAWSVEEAVEEARKHAEQSRKWGRYTACRMNNPNAPVEITIRRLFGRYEALIVSDPLNRRLTDEAVMARFDDPEEAA